MKLLTDGTEKDAILGFCKAIICQHADNWPPEEEVLADAFVAWLGLGFHLTRSALTELCRSKGINLSFAYLPSDIRGVNCSFYSKKEIVITEHETVPFADVHTLLHELREMLEHGFTDLGHPTIGPKDSLEVQAEVFAVASRIKALERRFPALVETASTVEKKWVRYLAYGGVIVFVAAYFFTCIYIRQIEEIASEAERQRYVRT